jgi:hypothetical protein
MEGTSVVGHIAPEKMVCVAVKKVKVKVKLALCVIKHSAMKTCGGERTYSSTIRDITTS